MSDSPAHPIVESELGTFRRAVTTLIDGEELLHDWYSAVTGTNDGEIEILVDTPDAAVVRELIPRIAGVFAELPTLRRGASDAVVQAFSEEEASRGELDDAARDLRLDTIQAFPGGDVVLHLSDECGEHFMDGYWPAVRFDAENRVAGVSIEA